MNSKRGISFVVLVVAIVVILILSSIVIIRSNDSRENARMTSYIATLRAVEESVDSYYLIYESFPVPDSISKKEYTANELLSLNDDIMLENEIIANEDQNATFYIIDTSLLGDIKGLAYGLDFKTANSTDVFVVSSGYKNVYYLKGMKINSNRYYSLSPFLVDSTKVKSNNSEDEEEVSNSTSFGKITVSSESSANKAQNMRIIFQISDGEDILIETTNNTSSPQFTTGQNIYMLGDLFTESQINDIVSSGKFIAKIKNGNSVVEQREIYVPSTNLLTINSDLNILSDDIVTFGEETNTISFSVDKANSISKVKYDYYYVYDFNNSSGYSKYYSNIDTDANLAKYITQNGKIAKAGSDGKYTIELPKNVRDIMVVLETSAGEYTYTSKGIYRLYSESIAYKNSANDVIVNSKVVSSAQDTVTVAYSLNDTTYTDFSAYSVTSNVSKYTNKVSSVENNYIYIKTTVTDSGKQYVFKDKLNIGGTSLTVTFDANGGTIDQTSKVVRYGETYGTLPTPTREGYVFKGWNGKNLVDYNNSLGDLKTINNGKVILDGSSVEGNRGNALLVQYRLNGIGSTSKSDYTNSTLIGLRSYIFNKNESFNDVYIKINTNKADPNIRFKNLELENGNNYTLSFNVESLSFENVKAVISNIQLEEGTIATAYEPYYITKDTEVVQEGDHTLTAIWEEGYEVTFDANGGTVDEKSKVVKYGEAYGTLPTPTRAGYTFKGWNGKNMFNYDSNLYWTSATIKDTINGEKIYKRDNSYNSSDIWPIFYTTTGNIDFEVGKQYTCSFDIWSDSNTSFKSSRFYINGSTVGTHTLSNISTVKQKMFASFIYNTQTSGSEILHIYPNTSSNTTNNIYVSNVLIEEGNTATDYEPYYITKDTEVVQEGDHTLTAIWEKNN